MALCASHAVNVLPSYLETFLKNVSSYFSRSSKRKKDFKAIQLVVRVVPHLLLLSASPYSGSPQRKNIFHFSRSTLSPSLAQPFPCLFLPNPSTFSLAFLFSFHLAPPSVPHKMVKLSQTRWLSREKVISTVIEQYDALILYFEKECKTDKVDGARKIFDTSTNSGTKHMLLFLQFILQKVNAINTEFQSEHF